MPVDVGQALVSYLQRRGSSEFRAVFLRMHAPAGALTRIGVCGVVHDACVRAGVPPVGAHQLRHTAATAMLREGASLSEIAHVLRHREIKTAAPADELKPSHHEIRLDCRIGPAVARGRQGRAERSPMRREWRLRSVARIRFGVALSLLASSTPPPCAGVETLSGAGSMPPRTIAFVVEPARRRASASATQENSADANRLRALATNPSTGVLLTTASQTRRALSETRVASVVAGPAFASAVVCVVATALARQRGCWRASGAAGRRIQPVGTVR